MKLFLDFENGRLATADGKVFVPANRSWRESETGSPAGREVTPTEAVEWLQNANGTLCRVPVAIIGGRKASPDQLTAAEVMGRHLARMGLTLLCGGRQGIMEAACRGAASANGLSIGLLPDADPAMANPYVNVPIATGIGIARSRDRHYERWEKLAVPSLDGTAFGILEREDENGEERQIPYAKAYRVFNADQIEGLPAEFYILPDPPRVAGRRMIPKTMVPAVVDALRERGWLPARQREGAAS